MRDGSATKVGRHAGLLQYGTEAEMRDGDYVRLVLESSFKESERFWTRNNGFLVIHGLLIGFFLKAVADGGGVEDRLRWLFVVVGIIENCILQ